MNQLLPVLYFGVFLAACALFVTLFGPPDDHDVDGLPQVFIIDPD